VIVLVPDVERTVVDVVVPEVDFKEVLVSEVVEPDVVPDVEQSDVVD
jgi:hypothetical protein